MAPGNAEKTVEKTKEKVKEPDMYRVVLHNDDYTTMEFVVEVIMKVFHKSVMDATTIMLRVHKQGRGTVGTFTYDVAQTKAQQVHKLARQRDYPLKATVEKA
ncbi:MAG: ATP-dependent Clp protease adapter ClpS [Spirochaetota bacterium]